MTLRQTKAWLFGILAFVVLLLALAGVGHLFGTRINLTVSEPRGLYIHTSEPSDMVYFCLPVNLARFARSRQYLPPGSCPEAEEAPLLKMIAARPGDQVDYSDAGVRVNGALLPNTRPLTVDSLGRPMQHYPFGRYAVEPSTAWTISTYDHRSFDSRYFGPVVMRSFLDHIKPFWVERARH